MRADLLASIRSLPRKEQLRLVEQVVHDLANDDAPPESPAPESIVGLFADEPALVEAVTEAAMTARERDPLRTRDG